MIAYGYDAVGNRISQTTNGVTVTNTFDLANRMTASGSNSYTFDANGNQTGQTVGGVMTSFTYDALDRLTAIGGPTPASYAYNGLNLRVRKTVGMTTTTYAWDLGCGLPQLLSDGLFSEYIYGHDLIGHIATSGGMTTAKYAHADVLGSVRLLTDGTGTEAGTALYDAFGAVRSQSGTQLPLGYTGEQRDAESGLIYLRARSYDPKTGRFLTTDPVRGSVRRPATQHAYVYALNNPLRYRDPRGREAGDAACCDAPAHGEAVEHSAPNTEAVGATACLDCPRPFDAITGGPDDPANLSPDQYSKYLRLVGVCLAAGGGDSCWGEEFTRRAVQCAKDPNCSASGDTPFSKVVDCLDKAAEGGAATAVGNRLSGATTPRAGLGGIGGFLVVLGACLVRG
jgi:RHS repeat-associated protein